MRISKYILLNAVLVAGGVIVVALFPLFASAASPGGRTFEHGYFNNQYDLATCSSSNVCNYGQVITNGFGNNPSQYTNKAKFINFIIATLQGGGRDGIGAAFIINTMLGLDGPGGGSTYSALANGINPATGLDYLTDWKGRINDPSVTILDQGYPYQYNSGYQKKNADDAYYDLGSSNSAPALVFEVNNKQYYALKETCANPIGSLPGLPPAQQKPTVAASGVCTVLPGGGFRAKISWSGVSDPDKPGTPLTLELRKGSDDVGAIIATKLSNSSPQSFTVQGGLVAGSSYIYSITALGIDSTGTKDNNNQYDATQPFTCLGLVPPPSTCVIPGTIPTPINLADPGGPQSTMPAKGYGDFGTSWVQYVASKYIINKVVSNAGTTIIPIISQPPPPSATGMLEYANAVNAYPYDAITPTVMYTTTYDRTNFTATGPAVKNIKGTILGYSLVAVSTQTGVSPKTGTQSGTSVGPLPGCDRNFNVTSLTATNPVLNPDNEEPTSSTMFGTVNVSFTVPNMPGAKGLLQPFAVQLKYSYNYYILRSSGGKVILGSSANQAMTVSDGNGLIGSGNAVIPAPNPVAIPSGSYGAGDQVCADYTIIPKTGTMKPDGTVVVITNAGPVISSPSPACTRIVNMPYVRAYGADVVAGGSFTPGSCIQTKSITAFTKPTNSLRGSGAQLGAKASGPISGFSSAALRGSFPTAPSGLSFANTGAPGNFGGSHCINDYFATKPTTATPATNPYTPDSQPTADVESYTGNLQINGNNNINGQKAIYVNGNVYITGNLSYKNGWGNNIDKIPSLRVFVKNGNIYIDPSVTQLDGIYVAQPGGANTGIIYTCATSGAAIPAANLYSICNQQLVINGSFVSQGVRLLRTYKSLRDSVPSESPWTSGNCTPQLKTCAAEVFNFSPENFLSKSPITPPGGVKYNYIVNLPPLL